MQLALLEQWLGKALCGYRVISAKEDNDQRFKYMALE
jgi:hypothetical protein